MKVEVRKSIIRFGSHHGCQTGCTCISAYLQDDQKIPTAKHMFSMMPELMEYVVACCEHAFMSRDTKLYVRCSACENDDRLSVGSFDMFHYRMNFSPPVSTSSLPDSTTEFLNPENRVIAVGISLLSCIEAELQVLPVWQPPF